MKNSTPLRNTALFAAGMLAGALLVQTIAPAQADTVKWENIAEDPGFRTAVIEVINSCIVENSIIYCN